MESEDDICQYGIQSILGGSHEEKWSDSVSVGKWEKPGKEAKKR